MNGQRCAVYCPSFCVTDHVAENERHLVDVTHESTVLDLLVPRQDGSVQLLATARVMASDAGSEDERRPIIAVDFEDVDSLYLLPSEVDAVAERVAAFEGWLRALGKVAADGAIAV
ncbi:DUF6907 domain-containing protein [Streptomyces sp. NPDC057694]|uniref:DUF6907 domain-containing protein n=1 Tax=Streptomyces sp. NPDC057694 TaxID=3346216 RepID=UPI00368C23F0